MSLLAYPTSVSTTPGTFLKNFSVPQKHPPAKYIVELSIIMNLIYLKETNKPAVMLNQQLIRA